ncbi:MAG: hypothetical protein IT426_07935 [Pirellulales bacterium]|nr:hypothetical protein [Pirellulales bacterium]
MLFAQTSDPSQAHTSEAVKQSVINALPLDKLDAEGRAKIRGVVSNVTLFRRLPVQVIDCDPDLYLFLVRHPDVVVNTWRALKISQLQLVETGTDQFRMKEVSGTTAELELLYKSHDTHILYAEGHYEGPILKKQVQGRAIFVLKTGYVRETNNRYYITSRLDALLSVDPGAVELVTKTIQPIIGRISDNNFFQTVSFVSSLSRTVELNSMGVQRLAQQLPEVRPDVKNQFASLADTISQKPTAVTTRRLAELQEIESANRSKQSNRR